MSKNHPKMSVNGQFNYVLYFCRLTVHMGASLSFRCHLGYVFSLSSKQKQTIAAVILQISSSLQP